MRVHVSAGFFAVSSYSCKVNTNTMLPIQKIHFTHLQQYDKNHCVYLARLGRHSEIAGENVTTHAQYRII